MIFNEEFDRTLYLILNGSKDNRGTIINFLKGIPEEMLNSIRETLILYGVYTNVRDNIGLFDIDVSNLRGAFKVNDVTYSYRINLISEALELESIFVFDERLENRVKLILYPLLLDEYKKMHITESICLGSLCDTYIDVEKEYMDDYDVTSYDLIKKAFNNYSVSSYDLELDRKICHRVDTSRLCDELKLDDYINNKKKLVRSKKRTR